MSDPVGTPASDQGNSATASVAVTVPSGCDVAYIAVFANASATISSMANFGGVAPQLVGDFNDALHLYRVISPAAGLTTAQGNLSAAVFWSIHVICCDNVDTADPDDTPVTNIEVETTSVSATVSSATNDLVIAFCLMVFGDIAAAAGATLSTEEEAIDGSVVSTALVYEAGAASVTLGASSSTQSFGDNQVIAINVRNAAGGGGTVNTQTLTSNVIASDAGLVSRTRGRLAADTLAITDVGLDYVFFSRLGSDSVTVTDGPLESFNVYGVVAISELAVSDEFLAWMRRHRLLQDNILVTDELISTVIGYLIFNSILTSNVTVTDQALDYVYFERLMESTLLTADQVLRALLVARDLLDGAEVTDSALTAMQRFILLTDTISLEDSLTALYIPETGPATDNPVIRIGFDQPQVTLGGYSVN